MMTFKDRYLAGEVEFEAIDDYVEEWNLSLIHISPVPVERPVKDPNQSSLYTTLYHNTGIIIVKFS